MSRSLLNAISLRHLVLVSTLGKELNLSRSAQLLHTTQPALSRALAQIEERLGTRLFNRTTKSMSLTPAGMSLLQHANRVLAELEMAEEDLAGVAGGGSGEVRVGALAFFSTELLGLALTRAREIVPGVQFSVEVLKLDALYDALRSGRVDVMLSHAEFNLDLNTVEVKELYQERSRIVVRRDHPLARRKKVSWEELAPLPWVLPSMETPLRPKLNRMLSVLRRGLPLDGQDVQTDSLPLGFSLVRNAGLVWAVAGRHAQWFARQGEVRVLDCKPELLNGPFCAFTLRGETLKGPTRVLIDCLRDLSDHAAD
jgi:LysR family transcriptional regulator, pca operon transcriptional activator